MFQSGHLAPESLERFQAEKLADLLYELGQDMSSKKDSPMAVKYLGRASDVINSQEPERLSRDAVELRTTITQALNTALLENGTAEDLDRATNLVAGLQSEMGNGLVVLLLRLEVLQKPLAEIFDSGAYAHVIHQMIKIFNFTGSTFKLILYHVRKLHDKSPGLGCALLDDLIKAVRNVETTEWIERLVVTRIWMATNQLDSLGAAQSAQDVISSLQRFLGADAAIAAQAVY